MRCKFKRIISSLLVVSMFAMSLPIQAFAEVVQDNGNAGSGTGGGSTNRAYTWVGSQSGFRIAIVDKNFNQVSNTVDLVFSKPTVFNYGGADGLKDFYTNTRANGKTLDNSPKDHKCILIKKLIDDSKGTENEIKKYPKFPITYMGNKSVAGGEDFKEWFLKGNGLNSLTFTYPSGTQSAGGVSDGITKPVLKDQPRPINDMPQVGIIEILMDSSYRGFKRIEAFSYIVEQGYFHHAQPLIDAKSNQVKSIIKIRSEKELKEPGYIAGEELLKVWGYCKSVSKTYAEAVYIYCAVIDRVAGYNYSGNDYTFVVMNIKDEYDSDATYNIASNVDITLEEIPLAGSGNSGDNGYADEILNWYDEDEKTKTKKPLFYFLDPALNKKMQSEKLKVTDIILQNNYYVTVEPIFWYRPAAAGPGGLPGNPMHPNYVYGTIGNWVDFHAEQGYKFGNTGGAYVTIMTGLGWSCFHINKDWVGPSGIFFPR
ncbi:hypothetical protein JOC37_002200 [Desulfohalotomaculum tongense]|uniref:hypothetical protein n=1 Tax=Desulforadius tongensis TaxID=1216062 RepID=UPI00195728C5|nr:hypothetical protein [Desulforadius tongensis]MBM7855785.1 hypothetical protein [Desulforadius tongensis]